MFVGENFMCVFCVWMKFYFVFIPIEEDKKYRDDDDEMDLGILLFR